MCLPRLSPAQHPVRSSVFLLPILLLATPSGAEFGVGFDLWPSSEVVARPGSQVSLPCSTNVTADKISWQYNHHFLLAPAVPDDAHAHAHRPPPFSVIEVEGGSELVLNLSRREGHYRHQLGLYQCVAWFGAIALTSLPGRLSAAVLEPFVPDSTSKVEMGVLEGGAARVECGNPPSVPEAGISFFRDGRPLNATHDPAYRLTPHGDLLILGVGRWAAGEYTCSAHNPVLQESVALKTRTFLKVVPRTGDTPPTPPEFVTLRTDYTENTGSNLTMLCLANGHPKPDVQWTRYGGTLPSRSTQLEDGSLLITEVAVEDEGTYLCHANNNVSKTITLDVALEVQEPASITQAPLSHKVEEGEGVSLVCTATGYPQPAVMWVFNGRLVRNDGNILITESGLTIGAVKKEHEGIFQCFAHNPIGTVQSVAMITVLPRAVTTGPVTTVLNTNYVPTETTDSRRWHNGPRYNGGFGGIGGVNGGERSYSRSGGSGHGTAPRKNHEKNGESSIPEDVSVWKKKGKKGFMVPPSKPKMTKVSDESVMVTWDGSKTSGIPILFYKIQYKLVRSRGNRGSRWMTVDEDIPPHINSYEVTGLQTGRTYRFRLAAVYANNDNKLGPNSRRFRLEKDLTIQRPSYPPTIVSLIPLGPTSVKLEWQYDPSPGVPVEGFFINYREATTAGEYTKVTVLGPNKRSFVISHLKANVSYDFKIQCFNIAGASEFSAKYKKNVAGSTAVTTEMPLLASDVVPIVKNDGISLSSIHLYIILGAVLGLLLLIVIVSAAIYTCRNKHSEADETRSTKYEDTSLHIHRETSTYTLPQNHRNNGQTPNGYLAHQGIVVTPAEEAKVAIESSFIENNNHNTQRMERCSIPSTRQVTSDDDSSESEVKNHAVARLSKDSCESNVVSCSEIDSTIRDSSYHS